MPGAEGAGGGNSSGRVVAGTDGNWGRGKLRRHGPATRPGGSSLARTGEAATSPRRQGSALFARRRRVLFSRESEPGSLRFSSAQASLPPRGERFHPAEGRLPPPPAGLPWPAGSSWLRGEGRGGSKPGSPEGAGPPLREQRPAAGPGPRGDLAAGDDRGWQIPSPLMSGKLPSFEKLFATIGEWGGWVDFLVIAE